MAWRSRPQGATRGVPSPVVGRRSAGVRAVDLGVSSAAHVVPKPAPEPSGIDEEAAVPTTGASCGLGRRSRSVALAYWAGC